MNKLNIFLVASIMLVLVVFRGIFSDSSLSLGDAPYLTAELLRTYIAEPSYWTTQGISFGGVNSFIWIHPYMSLIAVVQSVTNASPWLLSRLFFYIPAIVLALGGSYLFASRIITSEKGRIVASTIYTLNSFFLMVIDGGQVGVAVAYGLFPVVVSLLVTQVHSINKKSIALSLASIQLITLADPRIAILAVVTSVIINTGIYKNMLILLPLWLGINLYWIYPLFQGGDIIVSSQIPQFTSFLTGIFLFSPHFPQNLYGVINYPSVAFVIFPLALLGAFVDVNRTRLKYFFLWLILVFLVKGSTPPFPIVYESLVNLPLGSAFRDSTKFMVPLLFISSILIAQGLGSLTRITTKIYWVFLLGFVITLSPVILGNFSFVLSGHESIDVETINSEIEHGKKTAWVYERDSRAISGTQEVLDGKHLVDMRPFARINVGSSDRMNFLNSTQSSHWIDVFGIDHLVLNGNPRNSMPSQEETINWDRLNTLIKSKKDLILEADPRVYGNVDTYPEMYGVEKLFVVVGSDNVYEKLQLKNMNYKPGNFGHVFIEDGKWNISELEGYASESAVVINNGGGKNALVLNNLQKYFKSSTDSTSSQFAHYQPNDYLKYKYELLIRDVIYDDFDYNKGISFSTKHGEQITVPLGDTKSSDYILAMRLMTTAQGARYQIGDISGELPVSTSFTWIEVPVSRPSNNKLTITNGEGITIFNVAALIPTDAYVKSQSLADNIIGHFTMYTPETVPESFLASSIYDITTEQKSASRFQITIPEQVKWVVYTNKYSPGFVLSKDRLDYPSLPQYSATNIFYARSEWRSVNIVHKGQESVRWGMYFSVIALLVTTIGLFITWKK